jgi:hypothetical protein
MAGVFPVTANRIVFGSLGAHVGVEGSVDGAERISRAFGQCSVFWLSFCIAIPGIDNAEEMSGFQCHYGVRGLHAFRRRVSRAHIHHMAEHLNEVGVRQAFAPS